MRLVDAVARLKMVGLGLSGDANDDTGQFVFRDGRVSTHNGVFGLWANMDIGIETALPGDKLTSLLSKCNGTDVEFTNVGDSVRITCGRTNVTMRKLEITSKEMPELAGVTVDWRRAWTEALERASWSMSDDPQRPDLAGITMSAVENAMVFYSTIGMGITRSIVPGASDDVLVGSALIIPSRFMWAVQRVVGSQPCSAIQFADEYLHAVFGEGDSAAHLYGSFPSEAKPERYDEIIAAIIDGLEWVAVPAGLAPTLDRVEAAGGRDTITEITVANGKMRLHTDEDFGTVDDELDFPGEGGPIKVKAAVLRKAASVSNEIAISANCVGLRSGDGFMYVQATVTDATATPAPQEEETQS